MVAFIGIYGVLIGQKKQFENKVIYEGWKSFVGALQRVSEELADFNGKVQWLTHLHKQESNPIFNKGDMRQYRIDRWQEIEDAKSKVADAFIHFLRAYETNEHLFLRLSKMKTLFYEEWEKSFGFEQYDDFIAGAFPEIYGIREKLSDEAFKKHVENYWGQSTELSLILAEDMRREFQNETVAKVLGRKIPRRLPLEPGHKVLTKDGFIISS